MNSFFTVLSELILGKFHGNRKAHKMKFGVASKRKNGVENISPAFHWKGERKLYLVHYSTPQPNLDLGKPQVYVLS